MMFVMARLRHFGLVRLFVSADRSVMSIYGRAETMSVLRDMLGNRSPGQRRSLILRGELGIGKTALLDHMQQEADGCVVLRTAGLKCEATLPYAALGRLFQQHSAETEKLPEPQSAALRQALGLSDRDKREPDPLCTGLAIAGILTNISWKEPLLCLIDDAQWLDQCSADALTLAAHRVPADVAMIFTANDDGFSGSELPELHLDRLDRPSSHDLLMATATGLAPHVRDRILDEARGNPLAVIELTTVLTPDQRNGSATLDPMHLGDLPASGADEFFAAEIKRLRSATRALLTVLALDNEGRRDIVIPAARSLGATVRDLARAERAGLLRIDDRNVIFRHPLCRHAAYQAADVSNRIAAHAALAAAWADAAEPALSLWHRAAAAPGPNEDLAAALEQLADDEPPTARHELVSAMQMRAAELSSDRQDRGRRLAAAAVTTAAAGYLQRADELADKALFHTTDPHVLARLADVRATADAERGSYRDAAWIFLQGARAIAAEAPDEAADLLVGAARYAWFGGYRDALVGAAQELSALPLTKNTYAAVAGARGKADVLAGDVASGLPAYRAMVDAATGAGPDFPGKHRVHAAGCALLLGDDASARSITLRVVDTAHGRGVCPDPAALRVLAMANMFLGRHAEARRNVHDSQELARVLGRSRERNHGGVLARLSAIEGDEETCRAVADSIDASGYDVPATAWKAASLGLLNLGLGKYEVALDVMAPVASTSSRLTVPGISLMPDCIEAAAVSGQTEFASELLQSYDEYAKHAGQAWMEAVALRCHALLAGVDAGDLYSDAVQLHQRLGRPFERARTQFRYGEWLRRNRRSVDARAQLRAALESFSMLGASPWAERARAELRAAGEPPSPGAAGMSLADRLTSQELQVVQLAASGMSNQDIAARLFISPRTVGYHLWKAFPKLGVSRRIELARLGFDGSPIT